MRRTTRFLAPGLTSSIFHSIQATGLTSRLPGPKDDKRSTNINEVIISRQAVGLFNPRDAGHREALNALIDAEIAQRDEENMPLNTTFEKMAEWLKIYVNNPAFVAQYSDSHSLELVAEATFWSAKLGLETHLARMSYAEIRAFQPLGERFQKNKTARSILIDEVCKKMVKPAMSHEASFALGQAPWCVYARTNTFEKIQDEGRAYDAQQQADQSTHKFRR